MTEHSAEHPAPAAASASSPGPRVPRGLAAGALALLLPASMAVALLVAPHTPDLSQSDIPPTTPQPQIVAAQPQELTLVCLDTHVDPFTPTTLIPLAPTVIPADLHSTQDPRTAQDPRTSQDLRTTQDPGSTQSATTTNDPAATSTVDRSSQQAAASTIHVNSRTTPHAFALTAPVQTGGELRGMSLLPCTQPRVEHWFALGSTTEGNDTSIRILNPNATPATVTLAFWGATGRLDTADHTVTIPAGEATTIRPGRYAPNDARLTVHLTSDGPGLGAWMQVNTMNGEVPQGSTWVLPTHLATSHLITGMGSGTSQVRIANPNTSATTVTLTWMTDNGSQALPGGTLDLAAGSVTDVSLPSIAQGYAALRIDSADTPIVAHALTTLAGNAWPGATPNTPTWVATTGLTSTAPTRRADLPSAADIRQAITTSAGARIMRPTSVPTAQGLTIDNITLVAAHSTEDTINATLTGTHATPVNLPAGTVTTLALDAMEGAPLITFDAPAPVSLSIVVEATTPTGPLRAVMPITAESVAGATLPVIIQQP